MKITVQQIIATALLGSSLMLFPATSHAAGNPGCERKEQAIRERIEYAKAYNNKGQLAGLEAALANVQRWCSDSSLIGRAEERVFDKEQKVFERQRDLDKSRAEGDDARKIEKREKKLALAKEELEEAIQKRDALK